MSGKIKLLPILEDNNRDKDSKLRKGKDSQLRKALKDANVQFELDYKYPKETWGGTESIIKCINAKNGKPVYAAYDRYGYTVDGSGAVDGGCDNCELKETVEYLVSTCKKSDKKVGESQTKKSCLDTELEDGISKKEAVIMIWSMLSDLQLEHNIPADVMNDIKEKSDKIIKAIE